MSGSNPAAQLQGLQLHNQQTSETRNADPNVLPEQGNQDIRNWFLPNRSRPDAIPSHQSHPRNPHPQTSNPPIPSPQRHDALSPLSPSSTLRSGFIPSPQPIVVDQTTNTLPTEVGGIKPKQLGPIVKDFKGDPATVVISRKSITRIAANEYVPYTALARGMSKAHAEDDSRVVVNSDGTINLTKEVDRSKENDISLADWMTAGDVMVRYVRMFHGEERATAYEAHHTIVRRLIATVGWPVAVQYDIHARENVCLDPRVDLSVLDETLLNRLTLRALTMKAQQTSIAANPSSSFANRGTGRPSATREHSFRHTPYDKTTRPLAQLACYRCGENGHIVKNCSATMTTAGKRCPEKSNLGGRMSSALVAPNGATYCFSFASSSSCKFDDHCSNYHGCSICGSPKHGAASCTSFGK